MKRYTEILTVAMPEQLAEALKKEAERRILPVSTTIRILVAEALGQIEPPENRAVDVQQ